MGDDKIDSLLYSRVHHYKDDKSDNYIDHFLEQYRIYIHIFNSTSDRREKNNEFYLGLNTAIIGILGYLETKNLTANNSIIFMFAPLMGIAICYCWYEMIITYKMLNKAKFAVLHKMEEKLPVSLFKTEWELLGKGVDYTKYRKISSIQKNIPIIFIVLYAIIFSMNLPWDIVHFFVR